MREIRDYEKVAKHKKILQATLLILLALAVIVGCLCLCLFTNETITANAETIATETTSTSTSNPSGIIEENLEQRVDGSYNDISEDKTENNIKITKFEDNLILGGGNNINKITINSNMFVGSENCVITVSVTNKYSGDFYFCPFAYWFVPGWGANPGNAFKEPVAEEGRFIKQGESKVFEFNFSYDSKYTEIEFYFCTSEYVNESNIVPPESIDGKFINSVKITSGNYTKNNINAVRKAVNITEDENYYFLKILKVESDIDEKYKVKSYITKHLTYESEDAENYYFRCDKDKINNSYFQYLYGVKYDYLKKVKVIEHLSGSVVREREEQITTTFNELKNLYECYITPATIASYTYERYVNPSYTYVLDSTNELYTYFMQVEERVVTPKIDLYYSLNNIVLNATNNVNDLSVDFETTFEEEGTESSKFRVVLEKKDIFNLDGLHYYKIEFTNLTKISEDNEKITLLIDTKNAYNYSLKYVYYSNQIVVKNNINDETKVVMSQYNKTTREWFIEAPLFDIEGYDYIEAEAKNFKKGSVDKWIIQDTTASEISLKFLYKIKTFDIKFIYKDESGKVQEYVKRYDWNAMPEYDVPTLKYSTFTGWDKPIERATKVASYTAQYEDQLFTVNYYGLSGELLKSEKVTAYEIVTAYEPEILVGEKFVAWRYDNVDKNSLIHEDFRVTKDTNLYATYESQLNIFQRLQYWLDSQVFFVKVIFWAGIVIACLLVLSGIIIPIIKKFTK